MYAIRSYYAFSKNIRVVRLVDSFLEHARIWVFGNDGDKTMYLSSADWLNRNINRRIETAFPIEEPHLKDELWNILQLQLSDNVKARNIDENMNNLVIKNNLPPIRAQVDTYSYLCKIRITSYNVCYTKLLRVTYAVFGLWIMVNSAVAILLTPHFIPIKQLS